MITRKVTNKLTFTGDKVGAEPLVNTTYGKRLYIFGIKFFDHSFTEEQESLVNDGTNTSTVGYNKSNKKS